MNLILFYKELSVSGFSNNYFFKHEESYSSQEISANRKLWERNYRINFFMLLKYIALGLNMPWTQVTLW